VDDIDMDIEELPRGPVKNVAIRHQGGKKLVPADYRAAIGNTLIPSVFFAGDVGR
jgi:hypothetical protein